MASRRTRKGDVVKRILITGGRDYADREKMREVLSGLVNTNPDVTIIHGGARGADRLAGEVADDLRVPVEVHAADWRRWGRSAGFRRNQEMIEADVDLVVAFPGGRGTADCVWRAKYANLPVLAVLDGPTNEGE